jgi:hypothetical protein
VFQISIYSVFIYLYLIWIICHECFRSRFLFAVFKKYNFQYTVVRTLHSMFSILWCVHCTICSVYCGAYIAQYVRTLNRSVGLSVCMSEFSFPKLITDFWLNWSCIILGDPGGRAV